MKLEEAQDDPPRPMFKGVRVVVVGFCTHDHATIGEARACPEFVENGRLAKWRAKMNPNY